MDITAANTSKIVNFRAPADKRALIDRAAEASGKNRTDFILEATCEKAREVLADRTQFSLDRHALARFNQQIDAPLADTDALKRLLARPAPWER